MSHKKSHQVYNTRKIIMNIKRYEPQWDSSETYQGMNPDPNGEYVEYDDINIKPRLTLTMLKHGDDYWMEDGRFHPFNYGTPLLMNESELDCAKRSIEKYHGGMLYVEQIKVDLQWYEEDDIINQ
mgnify:CR=1 FL=1|tara:strand:- start:73 stop:447 length:375 start_codon:yes stop_codon:yes gene_type:complete